MDFYKVVTRVTDKVTEVYPEFRVKPSKDLMVRGGNFYAVWDEERGLWTRDIYRVQEIIDRDLAAEAEKLGPTTTVKYLENHTNGSWSRFLKYAKEIGENYTSLDQDLTFANSEVRKNDYRSRRLPYSLEAGDYSAWDELVGTLYSSEERAKIEWAIGAVVAGDAKKIQKFLVFYGPAGTGKSTILDIIQKLFTGYMTTFEAKALGSNNAAFATEVFKNNPLVAIQHDGDLSKIDDNTRLNSIVSHEEMTMNEKYKASYTDRVNAFLFMATNQPVKITDAKSGLIRRLIDVNPTGVRIPAKHFHSLMARIEFELGAIAHHCLDVYRHMGKHFYDAYRPLEMMLQTDVFYNFVEAYYDVLKGQNYTTLKQAYNLYQEFCKETGVERMLPQYKMREELRNYFDHFHDRVQIDGIQMRSVYQGFKAQPFKQLVPDTNTFSLVIEETTSIFDAEMADQPAQPAKDDGTPAQTWSRVKTTLKEIDTREVHYVRVPENHIVIDFDLRGDDGQKSLERNLEAASAWPPTYAELSKSGSGVHLHYIYTGEGLDRLAPVYSDGIEIKVFRGGSSLRRRLSRSNNVPIAPLSGGLPLKEEKMIEADTIKSEKGLRDLITRNLRKEIHPGTKPSIDFIHHILEEAYASNMEYDVMDLRPKLIVFANNSTHQALACLKIVKTMKFSSDVAQRTTEPVQSSDPRLVFFDVEVFPNLFLLCWKFQGSDQVVRMINPSAQDVEKLLQLRLVGFNNRRYDNHILYARYMGYNNEQLHRLSQKIVDGISSAMFGEAYRISYTDIYDFSSEKMALKMFMFKLGIHHQELGLPWDQPVPEDQWDLVAEYCENDVRGTEAVFEARKGDFIARQILAELSGLTVNDPTPKQAAKIIFGKDKNPQRSFVYTDLSLMFPGYSYDRGESIYRNEVVGEGGYVYAEPGMYKNVALLDVASMHPTSIETLNLFGDYTPKFSALKEARVAIKRGDLSTARKMFDGRLKPFLEDENQAKALGYALKIVINIVYGLTSAKFDNPFRDTRNIDNIVAKRGALFMVDLKNMVHAEGYTVAHIKTDSIKIPNADFNIINKVMQMGKDYGYEFEHEATYEKFCLVNDTVYVAKQGDKWTTVGAQFQQPVVYKTIFTEDPPSFDDMVETKQVMAGLMYLDLEHDRAENSVEGMKYIGRTGQFVPVREGGGVLYRVKDEKKYLVTGTKGFLWMEASVARETGAEIDMSYYQGLINEALNALGKFGDYKEFLA